MYPIMGNTTTSVSVRLFSVMPVHVHVRFDPYQCSSSSVSVYVYNEHRGSGFGCQTEAISVACLYL